ncbi:hypothetical protein CsSME_00006369 [Camellia sinensis var. sinensis]
MVELCQIVTRLLSVCLLVVCLVISVPLAEASRVRHFQWEVKHEFKSPDCHNKLSNNLGSTKRYCHCRAQEQFGN